MVSFNWIQPVDLTANFTKSRVLVSNSELGPHQFLAEIDSFDTNGNPITTFTDPIGRRDLSYIVRYFDPVTNAEFTDFSLTIFPFTVKEKRLVSYIAGWVPDLLKNDLNDFDVITALKWAVNDFNVYNPETDFTIDSFPPNYEQFIITGSELWILHQKFLKIAIRDFLYSDMGLSLTVDRGAKIKDAQSDLMTSYNATIALAKFNFTSQGVGLGTVPLPISVGGSLNRGLLNVLDIFNSMGR